MRFPMVLTLLIALIVPLIALIVPLIALIVPLSGCEGGKKAPEEKLPEEVMPPEPPEDLKDAEGAYTYLMTNWADGNFENVYLVCDAGTKATIDEAWAGYKSAREMIYENMEKDARDNYLDERDFGPFIRAAGVQSFFAELCKEGDYGLTIDDEVKAAGFEVTTTEDVDENTKAFENNWVEIKITMVKDGDYWFCDYFKPLADDALGRSNLDWNIINEDVGMF